MPLDTTDFRELFPKGGDASSSRAEDGFELSKQCKRPNVHDARVATTYVHGHILIVSGPVIALTT